MLSLFQLAALGMAPCDPALLLDGPEVLAEGFLRNEVLVGDLDGDGFPDIVTLISGDLSSKTRGFTVLLNDSGTGFQQEVVYEIQNAPISGDLADIDRDGDLDVIIGAFFGGGLAFIFLNDGAGSFTQSASFTIGSRPEGIRASDLDLDGSVDVIVSSFGTRTVRVFELDSEGAYQLTNSIEVAQDIAELELGDIDQDGFTDCVVISGITDRAYVLLNDSTGGLLPGPVVFCGEFPVELVLEDINGDGWLDLITSGRFSDSVSVALGDGTGGFSLRTEFDTGVEPIGLAVVDLNQDGLKDIVTANRGTNFSPANDVSFLENVGSGAFAAPVSFLAESRTERVASGNFDADGAMDLVVSNVRLVNRTSLLPGSCIPGPQCLADLAEPFGELNFFDITAFIGLFNAGDPAADFAAPFGSLNFFDVAEYIAVFNAGCP